MVINVFCLLFAAGCVAILYAEILRTVDFSLMYVPVCQAAVIDRKKRQTILIGTL
jgi:hypothetical protein